MRSFIYWMLDKVKGGNVSKHFNDIRLIIEKDLTNKELLEKLLVHAYQTVPYYQNIETKLISSFPIVDKTAIKTESSSFLSNKFDIKQLNVLTTSGSTGTPFSVYQDKNKKDRNTADTLVFAERAGYNLGDKLYYLKIWSEANKKSGWRKWMQNIETVDVLNLDDETLNVVKNQMEAELNPFGIIGYASALESLYKFCDRNSIRTLNGKANSIIAISETLSDDVKVGLTDIFDKQVVSRYSNVENGILAQQRLDGSKEFELNTASYYFEIVDIETNKVVEDGQFGCIVITDLYNYAMPMIRYDTGDMGIIEVSKITGQRVLSKLEGRKLDLLFNTSGHQVSSLLVYKNMWQYKEIDQYQLIQKSKSEYLLKLSCSNSFTRQEKIISEFKEYLGNDASITIDEVNEIPLLASGKRRKVVQEYYK